MGLFEESLPYHKRAEQIWEAIGDRAALAQSYLSIGIVHRRRGEFETALKYYEKSIPLILQYGDSANLSRVYLNMAAIHEAQGDVLQSLSFNKQALALSKKYDNFEYQALAHNNLANNYKALGDIPQAAEQYFASRQLFESTDNSWGMVNALNNLSVLLIDNQEFERALPHLEEAEVIAKEAGLVKGLAMTYANQGYYYSAQKNDEEGLSHFRKSLELVEENQILDMQPYLQSEIGNTLLQMGRVEEAEQALLSALEKSEQFGMVGDLAYTYLGLCSLYGGVQKWTQSQAYAQKGYALAQELQDIRLQANFTEQLIVNYEHFGDVAAALPQKLDEFELEDAFLQKIRETVFAHLDESHYRIEDLYKDVGISRTQLHKKIKALTGKSAAHFVRSIRLEKAKEILATSDHGIAQVAYEVGFSDPAYFSRIFAKEMGATPRNWREQNG